MVNTTSGLKNVNLLTKAQYDGISDLASNELYAVETSTVVETYSDDNGNWYRIYSDGWVEQGGVVSVPGLGGKIITLYKPMKDNKYLTLLNGQTYSGGTMVNDYFWVNSQTTTAIDIDMYSGSYSNNCSWFVCGQGE